MHIRQWFNDHVNSIDYSIDPGFYIIHDQHSSQMKIFFGKAGYISGTQHTHSDPPRKMDSTRWMNPYLCIAGGLIGTPSLDNSLQETQVLWWLI